MHNINRLRQFIVEFTQLVAHHGDAEATMLEQGGELLKTLVAQDDWLPEICAQPHPQYYQQYLIHCDPLERFSMVSFVWGPGQKTPVHNHQTWGLIGMLRGAETCRRYSLGTPGEAMIVTSTDSLCPGQIDCVSPNVGDIHEVANAFTDRVSISVHIYGANIGAVSREVFDPLTSTIKYFVSGYSNSQTPNLWDRSTIVRQQIASTPTT